MQIVMIMKWCENQYELNHGHGCECSASVAIIMPHRKSQIGLRRIVLQTLHHIHLWYAEIASKNCVAGITYGQAHIVTNKENAIIVMPTSLMLIYFFFGGSSLAFVGSVYRL